MIARKDSFLISAIFYAASLALALLLGFIKAHSDIALECERLGAFYVGEKTFVCEFQKPVKVKEPQ